MAWSLELSIDLLPVPDSRDEILARDNVNLDITWLKEETKDGLDPDSLPDPDTLSSEVIEELEAAELEAAASELAAAASSDATDEQLS